MCGIVGYVGYRQAQPVILNCLSKLEYRGYDSCGIAVCGGLENNGLKKYKDAVRVEKLRLESPVIDGTIGIGHTRWATHGLPTKINAHPHFDCSGKIAVAHNGIISNYDVLKKQLEQEGHVFISDTDTEVIPHLIEKYYRGDLLEAVKTGLAQTRGSFAVVVVMDGHDNLIVGRKDSPLVIGVGDHENVIASDVAAILDYTNKVIYLEDGDIASVSKEGVTVMDAQSVVDRPVHRVTWNKNEVEKNGYDHFLLKEIHEQPRVIRDSLKDYLITDGFEKDCLIDKGIESLLVLACGTSYHAGLVAKHLIEEYLGVPVNVELASEFINRNHIILPSAVLAITQSGETADVLLSLKKLKQMRTKIFVITNVPGSSASRLADRVIYTTAGPEVSVAATKSHMAQLIELYKIVLSSSFMNYSTRETLVKEIRQLPSKVQELLENEKSIASYADFLCRYKSVFFVGRGINYPMALEGALKLKEVSYIHAEGYAAGELKHGPFALLDDSTPVVAMMTPGEVYSSMISTVKEIKARRSPVIALANNDDESIYSLADMVVRIPNTADVFAPIINVVALQLFAYYAAKGRNCPIDFPRNLAKSVTVV
jgi:glutamine---fructose-6-phosphate transaminase (isomerizing)